MKILIAYKSKTGFTKKYAEWVAEEVNCTVVDFKEVTAEMISEYEIFVFGGGLHAGMINGLKQAREMFEKSQTKEFVIFATGGTPNDAADNVLDEVWKNNLSSEELENTAHFYMQSGICYENMHLPDKMLMKMVSIMLSKQKEKSEFDAGFEQSIKSSYDISAKEYALPLINYLLKY